MIESAPGSASPEKQKALSRLASLALDCKDANWDAAGADPVHAVAVARAAAFVLVLPDDVTMPEFAPEPDGCISADWDSPGRRLSFSFGPRLRVAAAWLDGASTAHAVEGFDGVEIPERLIGLIREVAGAK